MELKCLLGSLFQNKKLFALGVLNEQIQSSQCGPDVSDHPKSIPSGFFTSSSANAAKQCGKLIIMTVFPI